MPVLLRRSGDLPSVDAYDAWFSVSPVAPRLPADKSIPDLPRRLEAAFDGIEDAWLALGRAMGAEPTACWAHMPTAGSYGSDFGLMLAWDRLTAAAAEEPQTTLVVCDDPWLFRQLAGNPAVRAGTPPALWPRRLGLAVRGILARLKVVARALAALLSPGRRPGDPDRGGAAIIAYGHPASTADGFDAYFGDLMREIPTLTRMMHTDCPPDLARALARDGGTQSLRAWGSPASWLRLPFTVWRPQAADRNGPHGWLVKRAAARENGGGGPAMNRWQVSCQAKWLEDRRPRAVAWPWENHAWERALCRDARRLGVATVGYQHAVVGPHQFNFSPATNPDGLDSIPDIIVCNGPAYRAQLARRGIPEERLVIGGAFRISRFEGTRYDPAGPVYVALSAIPQVAKEMIDAVGRVAERGWRFIIKDHPLYPFAFDESAGCLRTRDTLADVAGISAVVYSTGTPGLEGLLAGVPCIRLLPRHAVALDVLPGEVAVTAVTADELANGLEAAASAGCPERVPWESIMAPVDLNLWRNLLGVEEPALRPVTAGRA